MKHLKNCTNPTPDNLKTLIETGGYLEEHRLGEYLQNKGKFHELEFHEFVYWLERVRYCPYCNVIQFDDVEENNA